MSSRPGSRWVLVACLAATLGVPTRAAQNSIEGIVDLRLIETGSHLVWLDGGLDKGRFGSDDEPLVLGGVLAEYRGRWANILDAHITVAAYDDVDESLDVTEAFLELKPEPRSAWRWRLRMGAFYPPVSLENTDIAWTSPYTLSFSAINTWIGEEVRTIGVEGGLSRGGELAGSSHGFGLTAGLFRYNDPQGALISWRGFTVGDRQSGLFGRLPLADLPGFSPSGSFPPQEPFEEPFTEIDGRTGYYVGVQWDYRASSLLRALHYDNLADPSAIEGGQWAWHTRFDSLGWHWRGAPGIDVLAQALHGETVMSGRAGVLVYARFRSAYVLASHVWGANRISLRFDVFDVADLDTIPDDDNREEGHAWTAAYFLEPLRAGRGRRWSLRFVFEARLLDSDRPARAVIGDEPQRREGSFETSAQVRW